MFDIKHWHTTLCVVRELGCAVAKHLLIHIIHDICHAVKETTNYCKPPNVK